MNPALWTILLFAGLGALFPAGALEVEGLPIPAQPRPLKMPKVHEKTLANGLRVLGG